MLCVGPTTFTLSEILHAPENATVFLNRSVAVFTCISSGGYAGWKVNGKLIEELSPELENAIEVQETNTPDGHRLENLTISTSTKFNGTRIQCVVQKEGEQEKVSKTATLKIQGMVMCP